MLQRECACGGSCADCRKDAAATLQTKLVINEPGDAYEQEADRVAEQVMRMPAPPANTSPAGGPDSASSNRNDTGRPQLQRLASGHGGAAEAASDITAPLGVGAPLDPASRAFFEPRFGRSFESVRIHDGAQADKAAASVQARAFTLGRDIVFAGGEHEPSSQRGKRLLAHELSHVIQQNDGGEGLHGAPGTLIQRDPKPGTKKTPPPVAGGNVLYIGMNNYKPEVAKLKTRFAGTSVSVTTVTVAEEESKMQAGGKTYDLTTKDGTFAFASTLYLNGEFVDEVAKLLDASSSEDRDDLAHVISVYSQTEQDGIDRMSRVVLSGHSYGTKVYNEDVKGAIYFDALVKLADMFPKAAGQTKHLLVLACLAGGEDIIKNLYQKAFPSLQTFWGYTNSCPTGAGAAAKLSTWADITDVNPITLAMPPSGQANWAMGVYQSDEPFDGPATMTALRADETKFDGYFAGTKVDPDNHSGFLFEYYRRSRTAAQHTSTVTGADHDYAQLHADQSFRLRFWPAMVSNFWKKNEAAITKGYGTAAVPNYGKMSRKDALAAIAKFDSISTATGAEKVEAARLLNALKSLDAVELNDNWLTP